ncbi:unnamed protein product [Linum trigynum]|uniref:Uncharacterized protein n=1 Tax=Linum trigynum TaxID=586398 RepID=A0AAV2EAG8_9ROSI
MAVTLGQGTAERVGLDAGGPHGGLGLVPTPTTEEIAAIRGKVKMPGYDNVVHNPCFIPLGPSLIEDEMGRVQRAGGGPERGYKTDGLDRTSGADQALVIRPVWNGQTRTGWPKGGRTGAGWADGGPERGGPTRVGTNLSWADR